MYLCILRHIGSLYYLLFILVAKWQIPKRKLRATKKKLSPPPPKPQPKPKPTSNSLKIHMYWLVAVFVKRTKDTCNCILHVAFFSWYFIYTPHSPDPLLYTPSTAYNIRMVILDPYFWLCYVSVWFYYYRGAIIWIKIDIIAFQLVAFSITFNRHIDIVIVVIEIALYWLTACIRLFVRSSFVSVFSYAIKYQLSQVLNGFVYG